MKLKRKETLERAHGQLSAADGRGSTLAHKRFTNEVGESEMPAPADEKLRAAESVMTIRELGNSNRMAHVGSVFLDES
jgi:hypothetical protein